MALTSCFKWDPMSNDNAPATPISQEQQAQIARRLRRIDAEQQHRANATTWMAAGDFFLNDEE
jgi:hypothetical protein